MPHEEIDTVRPIKRAPGSGVPVATFTKHQAIFVFQIDGGTVQAIIHKAGKRQRRRGEGRIARPPFDQTPEQAEHLITGNRHGDAEFSHLLFDTIQPDRIKTALGKQSVTPTHRFVKIAGASTMGGIKR